MSRGESAELREQVTVALPSDSGNRATVACRAIIPMTAAAAACVVAFAERQRETIAQLGLWIARCAREIGGEVPEGLRTIHVRRLEGVVHDRAVHLRSPARTAHKADELLHQITLTLPGEDGDFPWPIAPRVPAVAPRAMLEVKDHPVLQIRDGSLRLRHQIVSGTECRERSEHQYDEPQYRGDGPDHRICP